MQVLGRCCGGGRRNSAPTGDSELPPSRADAAAGSGLELGQNVNSTHPQTADSPHASTKTCLDDLSVFGNTLPASLQLPTQMQGPDASDDDLWGQAFLSLSPEKKEVLESFGFWQASGSRQSNIDALLEAVNNKKDLVERKQWGPTINGEKVNLRDYTTQVVACVKQAGDIAVQLAPPFTAVPWGVLKGLMNIAVIDSEQMEALLRVTDRLGRLISRGTLYQSAYLTPEHGTSDDLPASAKQFMERLVGTYATALDLLAKTATLLDRNTARRVISAFWNHSSIPDGLSALDQKERQLSKDVQALQSMRNESVSTQILQMLADLNAPISRMGLDITHLLEITNKADRFSMLDRISSVRFGQHHGTVTEDRTPGTGEWVLEDVSFRQWQSQGSSVFVLEGNAGTGKTFLTSTVIDHLQRLTTNSVTNEVFAYFYCDKSEDSRRSPLSILQSYVRQLAAPVNNTSSVRVSLKKLHDANQEKSSPFTFKQCTSEILASAELYGLTTLVLDALDECESSSVGRLLEFFNELVTRSANQVRIFISTRPNHTGPLRDPTHLNLEVSRNLNDIRAFLNKRLDEEASANTNLGLEKNRIIDKILERSQGMFQYASLQTSQISKCITSEAIYQRLEKLPRDIEAAYEKV
jgi:hypothetical protein